MDNASLDEFLDDATDGEGDSDAEGDSDGEAEAKTAASADGSDGIGAVDDSEQVDPATVDPAAVTSRWDGDGVVCASCGEAVERCWESADGLVCPACKEWS